MTIHTYWTVRDGRTNWIVSSVHNCKIGILAQSLKTMHAVVCISPSQLLKPYSQSYVGCEATLQYFTRSVAKLLLLLLLKSLICASESDR